MQQEIESGLALVRVLLGDWHAVPGQPANVTYAADKLYLYQRTSDDDGTVTIDRARYGGDFFPGVLPDHDDWETISIR